MKVLLVKPRVKLGDHIQPPLGLGYLAESIRCEHKVGIIDLSKLGWSIKKFRGG